MLPKEPLRTQKPSFARRVKYFNSNSKLGIKDMGCPNDNKSSQMPKNVTAENDAFIKKTNERQYLLNLNISSHIVKSVLDGVRVDNLQTEFDSGEILKQQTVEDKAFNRLHLQSCHKFRREKSSIVQTRAT